MKVKTTAIVSWRLAPESSTDYTHWGLSTFIDSQLHNITPVSKARMTVGIS